MHDRGYVHSNINPHNILFANERVDGRVRRAFLIGFGKAGKIGSHYENDVGCSLIVYFITNDRIPTTGARSVHVARSTAQ